MNIYGRALFTDDQLSDEIRAHVKAKRQLARGEGVGVIAGEGRRVEFVKANASDLDTDLGEMMYEARQRGLEIGGLPESAIEVEFNS
jgi:hypothetical protein